MISKRRLSQFESSDDNNKRNRNLHDGADNAHVNTNVLDGVLVSLVDAFNVLLFSFESRESKSSRV